MEAGSGGSASTPSAAEYVASRARRRLVAAEKRLTVLETLAQEALRCCAQLRVASEVLVLPKFHSNSPNLPSFLAASCACAHTHFNTLLVTFGLRFLYRCLTQWWWMHNIQSA